MFVIVDYGLFWAHDSAVTGALGSKRPVQPKARPAGQGRCSSVIKGGPLTALRAARGFISMVKSVRFRSPVSGSASVKENNSP
jgi:hypothetical protein